MLESYYYCSNLNIFQNSEVQSGWSANAETVIESCRRNKVCLKGIISSPVNYEGGILQTLNMKIRYGQLLWKFVYWAVQAFMLCL